MTTTITDADLRLIDLGLSPNEASGLCPIESDALLERLGWRHGFWTVLDDAPAERCIAGIGLVRNDVDRSDIDGSIDGWTVRRLLPLEAPDGFPATDDGEALAVHDGVVHVFGSLYGSKEGPLEPERQWLARFREDDVTGAAIDDERAEALGLDPDDRDPITVGMEIVTDEFRLHRAINDALADSGLGLLEPGPKFRKHLVGKARQGAIDAGVGWAWRLRWDDHACNIEGAAFLPGGELVLGLRFPVSRDGGPLFVVLDGIEHAFDDTPAQPHVLSVHTVANVGHPSAPVGVRDLHYDAEHDRIHVLFGNLDSTDKGSRLLQALPEGQSAVSSQWYVSLVDALLPARELGAVSTCVFPDLRRVEGMSPGPDGTWHYVVDEDEHVGLRIGG